LEERNEYLIGIFTALAEEHFFSARLPSRMTSKKFAQNDEDRKHLLEGLLESNVLSFIIIIAVYLLTKSKIAVIVPLIILAVLNILYLNDFGVLDLW